MTLYLIKSSQLNKIKNPFSKYIYLIYCKCVLFISKIVSQLTYGRCVMEMDSILMAGLAGVAALGFLFYFLTGKNID